MQTRGAGPLVVAVVVGVALTACGASSADGPSASPSASTDRAPVTPRATAPSAAAAVSRMTAQLDGAVTGAYAQTTRTRGDSFTVAQVTDTSYDLSRQAWTAHTHYEGNPPPDAGLDDLSQIDMTTVIVDGEAYMTMSGWPEKWRGRWLHLDPSAIPGGGPQGLSGEPFAVLALRSFSGMSVDAATDGTSTIKGYIDLEPAVGLLGVQTGVVKAGVDPSTLVGRAYATVVTDSRGLPVTLTLDGHDIFGDSGLPESVKAFLPLQIVEVRFDRMGSPVEVAVPATSSLIDPAEMQSGT